MNHPCVLRKEPIPAGEYVGMWGGHELHVMVEFEVVIFTTDLGIRSCNNPVLVPIRYGKVCESEIKMLVPG